MKIRHMFGLLSAGAIAVLCLDVSAAMARESAPPSEACDHNGWGFLTFSSKHYGTTNTCPRAIEIWFMTKGGQTTHAVVAPRAVFDAGLLQSDEFTGDVWAAASCPLGYQPSPAATADNWTEILDSRYHCVRMKK